MSEQPIKQEANPKAELAKALSKAQGEMRSATRDQKNPFYDSNYASLSSVFKAINDPFAKNELSITQTMRVLDNGRMVLRTTLMHASGESIHSDMLLPHNDNPQKLGASITYFRRYALAAIAGVHDADDDANCLVEKPKNLDHLWQELNTAIEKDKKLLKPVLAFCQVDSLSKINPAQLEASVTYVRSKANDQNLQKN